MCFPVFSLLTLMASALDTYLSDTAPLAPCVPLRSSAWRLTAHGSSGGTESRLTPLTPTQGFCIVGQKVKRDSGRDFGGPRRLGHMGGSQRMKNACKNMLTGKVRVIPSGKEKCFGFLQSTNSMNNSRLFHSIQCSTNLGLLFFFN